MKIAIVGATGMVGRTFLQVLEERCIKADFTLFASQKSAGSILNFMGAPHKIECLCEASFDSGFDIALFSAGGGISEKYAPIAASKGCVVVDNSSFWRMNPDVPLVIPEINSEDIAKNHGIIANPNCSTIQALVPLAPLHKAFKIKRVIYSTYQAVSGAGVLGCDDLKRGAESFVNGGDFSPKKFDYPIFNNCIPQIDIFCDNGYTKEEQKMIDETHKILHDDSIGVTATTVRVPVLNSHSESINIEFENAFELSDIFTILRSAPGVTVIDDPKMKKYPLALDATGKDDVFVGRIRRDNSCKNAINLWCVADNIRKGAATNAIQIAEQLMLTLEK